MKTFLRQYSKPAVSILLAMILMASTLMVGAITSGTASGKGNAADSSSVTIDNAVTADANTGNSPSTIKAKKGKTFTGANAKNQTGATYYLLLSYNNNNPTNMTKNVSSSSATFTVTPSSFGKTSWQTGVNYYVGISSSTSYTNMYSQGGSSAIGTVTGSITASAQGYNIGDTRYHYAYFCVTNVSAVQSVTVSVSGGANTTYNFTAVNSSYAISYNTPSNGSFTTKPTTGTSGNSIKVVATPSTGYQINTVSVYKTGASSTTVSYSRSGNTITFTMPAYAVTVNVTFSQVNYTITKIASSCTISASSTATYGSTVNFTVTPDTNYALKTLTVKQGSTNITTTSTGVNAYSFTMPAGNVTITANCTTTVGLIPVKFKSATAYVYHPFISINGGAEVEMTLGNDPDYLDQGSNINKPKSDTGSLRYAWYTADLTGVDTSKPVTITVRGQDTYMEATGTFTLEAGSTVYLACDNLMEGNTLVDVTDLSPALRDFYDTPLNMIDN